MNDKLKVLYSYLLLVILYAGGTLLLPPAKGTLRKYHISLLHLRMIDLTIVILYAAIWLCGFYGLYRLMQYSKLIDKNKDGKPVVKITIGIGLLAFWLPVSAVFNVYSQYLAQRHPGLNEAVAITQNYVSLLLPLIGFIFISLGTRGLNELTKKRPTLRETNIIALLVIFIGVFYVHLVSTTHNRLSVYHLNIIYILLTLVIPYIYMWFLGVLSFYEIYMYRRHVAGIVYRKSWQLLAFGTASIIVVSILIQYLTTISMRFNKLSLDWILLIIYMLLILLAVGYVLIAFGVNNLQKIEEV